MESNLAICGISSTDELCNDGVDGGNNEEDEDQNDPATTQVFPKQALVRKLLNHS
jgi:hypothetical protein